MNDALRDANSPPRVWLITGASRGLGRALAEAVISHGHCVVATARDPVTIADLGGAAPQRVRTIGLDVTDSERAGHAVEDAVRAFGRIDVVVNNAGVGLLGALEELSEEQLRGQFETNLFGVINVTRATLPRLRRQRSGHFVQISSVAGVRANAGHSVYAATKFALEGLSEGLAKEVAHLGIRVTIVESGPLRTDFAGRSMTIAEPIDDYAEVMGPMHERLRLLYGTQAGDPALAAEAIFAAVEREDPPLRLALGQHAQTDPRTVGGASPRARCRIGPYRSADLIPARYQVWIMQPAAAGDRPEWIPPRRGPCACLPQPVSSTHAQRRPVPRTSRSRRSRRRWRGRRGVWSLAIATGDLRSRLWLASRPAGGYRHSTEPVTGLAGRDLQA